MSIRASFMSCTVISLNLGGRGWRRGRVEFLKCKLSDIQQCNPTYVPFMLETMAEIIFESIHLTLKQSRFEGINFIIFSIKDRESNSVITFLGVRVIVLSLSKLKLLNAGQHSFLFIKNGCHISRNSYIADFKNDSIFDPLR